MIASTAYFIADLPGDLHSWVLPRYGTLDRGFRRRLGVCHIVGSKAPLVGTARLKAAGACGMPKGETAGAAMMGEATRRIREQSRNFVLSALANRAVTP